MRSIKTATRQIIPPPSKAKEPSSTTLAENEHETPHPSKGTGVSVEFDVPSTSGDEGHPSMTRSDSEGSIEIFPPESSTQGQHSAQLSSFGDSGNISMFGAVMEHWILHEGSDDEELSDLMPSRSIGRRSSSRASFRSFFIRDGARSSASLSFEDDIGEPKQANVKPTGSFRRHSSIERVDPTRIGGRKPSQRERSPQPPLTNLFRHQSSGLAELSE
eukprot:CAMPEP_0116833352 /NCGR_PEP_ID=MMETSP0418-20121206/6389_1 /TAXON_ID=1158023 /ORGANISM="Astrosyne radiata, Strain 13vi08-1A" /LENGTH=216 /DNA_ID=CAMNT_0004462793 /DNA_START=588 /DNA_END=1238 /DNA_ORIENTATION=-